MGCHYLLLGGDGFIGRIYREMALVPQVYLEEGLRRTGAKLLEES